MPRNTTTLVLLPGLDGTEIFFRPLLAALPTSVRPRVICYPGAGANGYADLLPLVRDAVADLSEFYVLGWSFAGPLALMLAAAEPHKTRGVILCATFLRAPRAFYVHLRFMVVGPVIWMYRAARRLPVFLLRKRTDPWRRAKLETWTRVSARVVAARMRAVLAVDARSLLSTCVPPLLCLTSREDDVVPQRNVEEIVRVRPSIEVVTLDGPHMAMYTNPESAVDAIVGFISR